MPKSKKTPAKGAPLKSKAIDTYLHFDGKPAPEKPKQAADSLKKKG